MLRDKLIQQLLQAAPSMVQGGLSETTRRCGTPSCICHRDPARQHGPNLYITYRADGKSRSLYVPPAHAEQARQAQQAWATFWELGCAIAAINRDQLRQQWQRGKKAGVKPGQREAKP